MFVVWGLRFMVEN